MLGNENKYDPTVNPSTSQEFSTGAFRVLHNIIPAKYRCKQNTQMSIRMSSTNYVCRFIDSNSTTVNIVNVTDWMNRPYLLQQGSNYDNLLRGLLSTKGRLNQPSYNPLVQCFLIKNINNNYNEYYFNVFKNFLNVVIWLLFILIDFELNVSFKRVDRRGSPIVRYPKRTRYRSPAVQ